MALVRSLGNNIMSDGVIENCLTPIQEALRYAGYTDLQASLEGSSNAKQVNIHTGETADDSTTLVRIYNIGGDGYIMARANSTVATSGLSWGLLIKIVATKNGVAIISAIGSAASNSGAIITKDSAGNYVILTGSARLSIANPFVMPCTDDYTVLIQYGATTSPDFGSTALSLIPVPSFDGTAKYLPAVAFAHAVQYQVDGSVTLGNQKWYSIGGSWYLLDDETE